MLNDGGEYKRKISCSDVSFQQLMWGKLFWVAILKRSLTSGT